MSFDFATFCEIVITAVTGLATVHGIERALSLFEIVLFSRGGHGPDRI
jgi:hypothetical protein